MTLVSDGERLTGAYALGPEAGEWLQQATVAIRARVPLSVLFDVIQPFPSFSEAFLATLLDLESHHREGNPMEITDSIAVVTGANRGLGRHFAEQLLERETAGDATLLVNNAGISTNTRLSDGDLDDIRLEMEPTAPRRRPRGRRPTWCARSWRRRASR